MARNRIVIAALFLSSVFFTSCRRELVEVARRFSEREFGRQMVTVSNMRQINIMMTTLRENHRRYPRRLEDLVPAYARNTSMMKDGWGREFYYYSSGDSFVLASFGKSGNPRRSLCEPGCLAKGDPDHPYDTNIVMINGVWAQTPEGIDR